MQTVNKRKLEKEIINLTEEVIESTIRSCQEDWAEETRQKQIVSLISFLAAKLSIYLDGQDVYLKELIHQLIQQKLPDERIMNKLPDFSSRLSQVIDEGIVEYNLLNCRKENKQKLEESRADLIEANVIAETEVPLPTQAKGIETVEQPVDFDLRDSTKLINISEEQEKAEQNNQIVDEVEFFLRKFFPYLALIKNYNLHGTKLQYYFPELKLAVEKKENINNSSMHASQVWKEYHCMKAGIKLLSLSQNELLNFRTLNKFIKKHAIN